MNNISKPSFLSKNIPCIDLLGNVSQTGIELELFELEVTVAPIVPFYIYSSELQGDL